MTIAAFYTIKLTAWEALAVSDLLERSVQKLLYPDQAVIEPSVVVGSTGSRAAIFAGVQKKIDDAIDGR